MSWKQKVKVVEGLGIVKLATQLGVVGYTQDVSDQTAPWSAYEPQDPPEFYITALTPDGGTVTYLATTPGGTVLYDSNGAQYIVPYS